MAEENGFFSYFRLALAVIGVIVAALDVVTDWIAFGAFASHDGGKLTAALGVFCAISVITALFEVRNGFFSFRLIRRQQRGEVREFHPSDDDDDFIEDPEETRLQLWIEVVSFLVLALEDFPVIVILYVTFREGNCDLFHYVFENTFIAKLSLLGTFISTLVKIVMSLVYCCRVCRCQFRHVKGCCANCCCCCCRLFRPILAIILCSFAGYLYTEFGKEGTRPDCMI